ncbi:hypothetical protein BDN72DRAFT_758202 [Pluteus cervinus]|uniref:Uncharacterized protein n=1 Tax=Pluteus cervinus TaxID=181527 RepID=A0ACD3BAX9_9AGAR|nr:hypothetical protein BDN72DRAFT_758202 [Pluteus cervinus]
MTAFARLATLAVMAIGALAQSFTINTPTNVVVCQPILLSWTGGVGAIHDGNNPSAAAIEDLGPQNGTSFTWIVNVAAGTSIGLALRDSTGQSVQSASFTVNPGTSTSCVGQAPSGSAGTVVVPPPNTSAAGGSTPPSTSAPAAGSSGSKPPTPSGSRYV